MKASIRFIFLAQLTSTALTFQTSSIWLSESSNLLRSFRCQQLSTATRVNLMNPEDKSNLNEEFNSEPLPEVRSGKRAGGRSRKSTQPRKEESNKKNPLKRRIVSWAAPALLAALLLSQVFSSFDSSPNYYYYQSSYQERVTYGPDGRTRETSREESVRSNFPGVEKRDLAQEIDQTIESEINDIIRTETRFLDFF